MWFWDKILASMISISMLGWNSGCDKAKIDNLETISEKIENVELKNVSRLENKDLSNSQERTKKEISVCLDLDDENSFTHTDALEEICDPQNVVLEYPINQLFQKYWNCSHPLAVSGVKKNFRALLWKNWIERLSSKIPQKLSPRAEEVTSDTKYEMGDTLRFSLIDPLLKDDFPQYLSDQLKEEWFTEFSDTDAKIIDDIIANKKNHLDSEKKSDFIYDIVVKKVPSWKAALALYRNWELFMATYVSVGLNSRKTQIWQYKVLSKEPYKRSRKYDNAAMPEALNFFGGYYLHQWNVTWYPASHGCVRLPGVYADILYSSVKNPESVDVFVSKNLYK